MDSVLRPGEVSCGSIVILVSVVRVGKALSSKSSKYRTRCSACESITYIYSTYCELLAGAVRLYSNSAVLTVLSLCLSTMLTMHTVLAVLTIPTILPALTVLTIRTKVLYYPERWWHRTGNAGASPILSLSRRCFTRTCSTMLYCYARPSSCPPAGQPHQLLPTNYRKHSE